jgi:hypothetical protein
MNRDMTRKFEDEGLEPTETVPVRISGEDREEREVTIILPVLYDSFTQFLQADFKVLTLISPCHILPKFSIYHLSNCLA